MPARTNLMGPSLQIWQWELREGGWASPWPLSRSLNSAHNPTQTNNILACAINIAENSPKVVQTVFGEPQRGQCDKQWEIRIQPNAGNEPQHHQDLFAMAPRYPEEGKPALELGCPVTSMATLHPSHGGRRDSPAGESSLPSCRRSCHTSLPDPMGLNAVRWVIPTPAWGKEEHHQGLVLLRGKCRPPPHPQQLWDPTLTPRMLPSNANSKPTHLLSCKLHPWLLSWHPPPKRVPSGKSRPHSCSSGQASAEDRCRPQPIAHPSFPSCLEAALPPFSRAVQPPPAGSTPLVPALYLLPGRDGKGEGVHTCAVVQQDSSNTLALLLEGKGLIPVPSASVLLRSRAILQAEHDGDVHVLIPPILHLPDEHSHRQAGVLAETDNTVYRAGAPWLAVRASLFPAAGETTRDAAGARAPGTTRSWSPLPSWGAAAGAEEFGGRQYKIQITSPGLANAILGNTYTESSV